jgi:hypothetical protein
MREPAGECHDEVTELVRSFTAEIGGLFPLLASNGLPAIGARVGNDVQSGGDRSRVSSRVSAQLSA